MVSPEAHIANPAQSGLYLTTAGFNSHVIRLLRFYEVICLIDFPTGLSVQYAGESPYAVFHVNKFPARRVINAPFYVNENIDGDHVRTWTPPSRVN